MNNTTTKPSLRAELITRRTYCRQKPNGTYETWDEVCDRVIHHQTWLWERALGRPLNSAERDELDELYGLMVARKALPSGRILWMGGTDQAKRTEVSMFNCAFTEVRDIYSAVDAYYLLLNGCGVGFKPVVGLLNGFTKPATIEVRRSIRNDKGDPDNSDGFYTREDGTKVYHLIVGDSGKAWAKAFGKLLAMKDPVDVIVLDFTEIRPAGATLSGYGWLSSGDEQIATAFFEICKILNKRAGELLTEIDILDLINLAGTTLTSRRSAEIAVLDFHNPLSEAFRQAKVNHYEDGKPWRSQSNNSVVFWHKPSKLELKGFFTEMVEGGGSEPGLINGAEARRRAPWFSGVNPCGEILLPDGGLCNLVEVDLGKFIDDPVGLNRAVFLISRANYRQTGVDLQDGTLSDKWHHTNRFLRLCGVGLTGIASWRERSNFPYPGTVKDQLASVHMWASLGANSMADELGLPRAKAVTTVKPSGTLGKIMDTTEGLHKPLGRYIFNWVRFSWSDPMVDKLQDAGYRIKADPYAAANALICLPHDNGPMSWDVAFIGGEEVEVNLETAVDQLERYKLMMTHYVDHNASVSISYDPTEIPKIVEWLHANWDSYVGVSFIPRTDPTKTAADLGYPYLPQEVVSKSTYDAYVSTLSNVSIDGGELIDTGECATGACPIR